VWREFVEAIEDVTEKGTVICRSDEVAWGHFASVVSSRHADETEFRLFIALEDSLGGLCVEVDDTNHAKPTCSEAISSASVRCEAGKVEAGQVGTVSDV
jgi:hypothetical protein